MARARSKTRTRRSTKAKPRKPRKARRKARSAGYRGISRIDQPSTRTHGWFVRVGWHMRRNGSYGPRHTRFFGDVSHGGKRKALLAAQRFVKKVG